MPKKPDLKQLIANKYHDIGDLKNILWRGNSENIRSTMLKEQL